MRLYKTIAMALAALSLSACGGFMTSAVPIADSTYVAPRASVAPVSSAQSGAGASGGGGGSPGTVRR